MADSHSSKSPADLVKIDDAMGPAETGASGSSAGSDSIFGAAEVFQQQLEQMSTWKQQFTQQMDLMRKDSIKVLERQKALAEERKQIADERVKLTAERDTIRTLKSEADGEAKRLAQRAAELEKLHQQLQGLHKQREQAEREQAARQKSLLEHESRNLSEDVRLREGISQLEEQRKQLTDAQRQANQERESLAVQLRDVEQRTKAIEQQSNTLHGKEQETNHARQQLEQDRQNLQHRESELNRQQGELQTRLAEVQAGEQHLTAERETLSKQRQELHRKLESFEQEHAEQLDSLSKQTKRLAERRTEVEAAEANIETALADRIAKATEAFKRDLSGSQEKHQQKIAQLEAQLQQSGTASQNWQAREQQFQQDLTAARAQVDRLNEDLRGAGSSFHTLSAELQTISTERSTLAKQLATHIEQSKQETARWEQKLRDAQSNSAGGNEALQGAQKELSAAHAELDSVKKQFAALQTARDELEFQLELRKEEKDKEIESITQQLKAKAKSIIQDKTRELEHQVKTLEGQRDEIAHQLFNAQDGQRRQQEEGLLARNALEAKIAALETTPPAQDGPVGMGKEAADWHRHRLLRQAKALRTFRQQIKETQTGLESGRSEIAQQREQLRARKENLEQVKRLLEKQEMVMARKLADHNAIKTVAAVGIFVIMVLGSVFFGVYRFIHPMYRSEAVVQLTPPAELSSAEVQQWFDSQAKFLHSEEVSSAAWRVLRSPDEHYGMHDVREEWLASLPKHLMVQPNPSAKTVLVQYTGPDAEGVSQVCNAIAAAYAEPSLREATPETLSIGHGAQVIQATKPLYPAEDNRLTIFLSVVAGTLFGSLVLVMIFRHFIARQLKEIDRMADAKDLEDIRAEIPETEKAVAAVE